jgi:ACS family tartrate transporter-like MFS transporter
MTEDLGFSEAVFGFGSGIFFVGYLLLEVPGALIVQRWGARWWMARILITWGLCTGLIGMVHTPMQFYLARTLLGIAEGGFFPAIIVYLTQWFTKRDRARAMAGFLIASPAALVIGSPISAFILQLDWFGVPGWRWMFILEGVPAVLVGIITIFYMTDHPRKADWLSPEEQEWIASQLEEEKQQKTAHLTIADALRHRSVLLLALASCFGNIGIFAFVLWLPTMIQRSSGLSTVLSTAYSALPFICALVLIPIIGRYSDRTGKRKLCVVAPLILAATFLSLSAIPNQSFTVVLALLCATGAFTYSWGISFWVLPTLMLGEAAAAASIGFINIIGNLGSFFGPSIVGLLLSRGFSLTIVVFFLSSSFLVAALLVSGVSVGSDKVHNSAGVHQT